MTQLLLLLALVAVACATNCVVSDADRMDCGRSGTTQQECEAGGCCWSPLNPNPSNLPWCFYGADHPQPSPPQPGNSSFTDDEIAKMKGYFLANINIQGKGGVVAAPDTNTQGGSYYFHWMRDGGISMSVAHTILGVNTSLMRNYVGWVANAQRQHSPNGIDVRGEPKFMLPNGEVFSSGWCRPQNDGAGLRANTLSLYALDLINNGQRDYAQSSVWPLVKNDCEYVLQVWNQNSQQCDLWEEIRGEMFFTVMAQRKGLLAAAKVADKLGDSASAGRFRSGATQLQSLAANHWNGNILYEAQNRQKDSATILAILYGYDDDDFLGYTDAKVVATVTALNKLFYSMFSINGVDDAAGVPGILWGRYEGDSYAGGHPWVLNTGGLADLHFRQATQILKAAQAGRLLGAEQCSAMGSLLGQTVTCDTQSDAVRLAARVASVGEGVLQRIRVHVAPLDFHLPEQLNRNTGAFANAHDLTWSYGSVLLALHNRQQYFRIGGQLL